MLVRKKTLIFFIFCCAFSLQTTAQKSETKNICSGSSITLQATEKTGATYKWFANNVEIPNETESTLTVSPTSTTTYHAKVTTAGNSSTASLIPNGGFESGNILGETNDLGQHIKYEYSNMKGIDKAITPNNSTIASNAKIANSTWFVDLKPNTGNKMLVCDGGNNPDTRIWSARDLALVGGKKYEFSCYVANIHINSLKPAGLQFIIETAAGTQTLLSFSAPTSNGKWEFHKITYTPPADASWAHIWINNNVTAPDGNDFAIDDIYFGLEQTTDPVTTEDNFTVNVDTKATISMANITDCANKNTTLSATVTGGTNNTIAWTKNSAATAGTTNSLPITVPATIGNTDTYTISVTSGVCSAVTSSATVKAISCTSNQKDTICSNTTLVLNSSNTNTYTGISWTPSTGLSDASNATPTFTPTSSGDFQFIMTGTNTSTSTTETITVNVNVKDCGITTVIDTTVCAGDSIIVGPQIYRTSGSYSYTFVGGSQLGADSTVIVNLTVVDINIIASETEICIGESLSLQGTANNNLTWTAQWTALPTELGINSSTAKTTAVNGTTDGNFDVTLSASVTKSGSVILATPLVCTAKIPITVHSNPVISEIFTTGRNATIILSTNEGTAPFTYTIDNEDYIVSSLSDLAIGEHSVEITDAEGCKTSGIFNIVPVPIIPAKFFSPNGDGVNDRWVVKGIDFYPGAIIQIFDRFGKELISYHGYDLGWDGTYDGKMMMTTDYWYLITVDEITKVISGHFTLKK